MIQQGKVIFAPPVPFTIQFTKPPAFLYSLYEKPEKQLFTVTYLRTVNRYGKVAVKLAGISRDFTLEMEDYITWDSIMPDGVGHLVSGPFEDMKKIVARFPPHRDTLGDTSA